MPPLFVQKHFKRNSIITWTYLGALQSPKHVEMKVLRSYIIVHQDWAVKLQSSCLSLSLFVTSLSVVVSVWWRCCCWSTAKQVWFLANKRTRRTCEKERRPAAGSCITHWPGSWKQNRSITSNTYLQILGTIYIYIFFGLDQFIMCKAKLAWRSLSWDCEFC